MKHRIEPYSDAWFYWVGAITIAGFTLFRCAAETRRLFYFLGVFLKDWSAA